MDSPSELVKPFAYAAITSASNLEAAKLALEAIIVGQYQSVSSSKGLTMTAASAEGKSFTYSFTAGIGPDAVQKIAFQALQIVDCAIVQEMTDDELKSSLLRFSGTSARVRFC